MPPEQAQLLLPWESMPVFGQGGHQGPLLWHGGISAQFISWPLVHGQVWMGAWIQSLELIHFATISVPTPATTTTTKTKLSILFLQSSGLPVPDSVQGLDPGVGSRTHSFGDSFTQHRKATFGQARAWHLR